MSLKVIAFVDPMSAAVFDYDTDKEYAAMERNLSNLTGLEINIEKDIPPHDLKNRRFDLYIMDYGGMMPGCDGMVESLFRTFIEQADEHPSAAFLVYSSFSRQWYSDLIKRERRYDFVSQANVFFEQDLLFDDANLENFLLWMGLELPPNPHEGIKLIDPATRITN